MVPPVDRPIDSDLTAEMRPVPVGRVRLGEVIEAALEESGVRRLGWAERLAGLVAVERERRVAGDPDGADAVRAELHRLLEIDDAARQAAILQELFAAEHDAALAPIQRALETGELRGRIVGDRGVELEIEPAWWRGRDLADAARLGPAIYFAWPDLARWLGRDPHDARLPHHEQRFRELVRFLGSRCPAGPTLPPSEADDLVAARARFGEGVTRALIRQARLEAYGGWRPRRGKPRRCNSPTISPIRRLSAN